MQVHQPAAIPASRIGSNWGVIEALVPFQNRSLSTAQDWSAKSDNPLAF